MFGRSRLAILKRFPRIFNIKALPTDLVEGLNKNGGCSPVFRFLHVSSHFLIHMDIGVFMQRATDC